MAERKSVKLSGDYNLKYFAKSDKSLLQSVISPYNLKPSNIDTATRVTNASSTYMDYIIPGDYETGIIADTILKADRFATITVPKSKNNIPSFTIRILFLYGSEEINNVLFY